MYIELDLPYMYSKMLDWTAKPLQCTEVRFASLLSGGFITAVVVNQPERKLAKRTSVQCLLTFWQSQEGTGSRFWGIS